MKKNLVLFVLFCCVLLIATSAFAQTFNGQASITLKSCNDKSCYKNNTDWALGKCEGAGCKPLNDPVDPNSAQSGGQAPGAPLNSGDPVHWNVGVQNFTTDNTGNTYTVFGFMDIVNTGSADAYLGNLVINLQVNSSKKSTTFNWITKSSDITNSSAGDAATTAKICSTASSEGLSSFTQNAYSGSLKLYDQNHNDLTAFPDLLHPGQEQILLYEATFDAVGLGLTTGQQIRIEAIVTFANSGPRGGSGSSCTYIDANGDGTVDQGKEHYDRSVPCRTTINFPALEHTNASVTLSDPVNVGGDPNQPVFNVYSGGALTQQAAGLTTVNLDGTLVVNTASTDIGGTSGGTNGTGSASLTSGGSFIVDATATLTGNLAGLDNCATLINPLGDDLVVVNDPLSLNTYTFTCQAGTNLKACAWPLFGGGGGGGRGCTYTQGGWGADRITGGNPASYLNAGWTTVYGVINGTNGVVVGGTNKMKFTSPAAIAAYLPAGGTPAALTVPLLTNTTTSSSGVFGGQVLALQLSVDFGSAGVGWATPVSAVGGITYSGTICGENGRTVSQILADANVLLGGGTLTGAQAGCTIKDVTDNTTVPPTVTLGMNTLVTSINEGFDECKAVQPPFSN